MNIVGLELESFKAQLVKLKKKRSLTYELGQGKVVLDFMQVTVFKAKSWLQQLFATKLTINPINLNKQKMICKILQVHNGKDKS